MQCALIGQPNFVMFNFTYLESLCYLQITYRNPSTASDESSPCVTTHWDVILTLVSCISSQTLSCVRWEYFVSVKHQLLHMCKDPQDCDVHIVRHTWVQGRKTQPNTKFFVMEVPSKCESSVCICVRARKMVTCKSLVLFEYRGERLIEPSSSWFPPNLPTG